MLQKAHHNPGQSSSANQLVALSFKVMTGDLKPPSAGPVMKASGVRKARGLERGSDAILNKCYFWMFIEMRILILGEIH